MRASTCRRCTRRAARPRPMPGRSMRCSRPPKLATRRATPSASGSASLKTTSTPQVRSSNPSAQIMNAPGAWAGAKRDAPQIAEQLWPHGMPAGPKGRYAPFLPYFYGIWNFGRNKSAAKSLLVCLSQQSAVGKMVETSGGYALPAFEKVTTFKSWAEEGPPKGTLYHYPNPHNHQILSVAAQPAPPKIAVQIYTQAIPTKMVGRSMQGEPLEQTLAWAETEVEGFMRT